ncbi:MAG: hypothetical protein S4CHLAM81_08000 [Chlamydiales bacterium]|nr:hypothetical protein [Chlamydiales bacterium]MCH9635582.1 hypothetical protein [Chlamydiales bacterium]MCH9704198.1 hypothetical protein [Chlamydiota bacterium]
MRRVLYLSLLLIAPLEARHSLCEMKRDLQLAEKELEEAHSKVLHLRETIARKEIARILKDLDYVSGNFEERLDFLDLCRKNLSSIMNEVPSCIGPAQEVLDEILVAITELKESQLEVL